jgi:spore maturation protein CgeB
MKVLVVSPGFHGYSGAMAVALRALGHEPVVHAYDQPVRWPGRVAVSVLHRFPESERVARVRAGLTDLAIGALREVRPDVVVIVKGDQLGGAWWEALAECRLPRVTWLYDELRRMRYTAATLEAIGPLASYSLKDVDSLSRRGVPVAHVPVGFDHFTRPAGPPVYGLTFVGARYASRERTLRFLTTAQVPVTAYGRDWSRHPLDVVRSGFLTDPGVRSARALARERAYGVMKGSHATLNLHGDQDGFTMRTFEAAGVGGVQLCDRADVARHYEPGREVLTFSSEDELLALARRSLSDRRWADEIRRRGRRRTLAEHTLVHRMRALEALWD